MERVNQKPWFRAFGRGSWDCSSDTWRGALVRGLPVKLRMAPRLSQRAGFPGLTWTESRPCKRAQVQVSVPARRAAPPPHLPRWMQGVSNLILRLLIFWLWVLLGERKTLQRVAPGRGAAGLSASERVLGSGAARTPGPHLALRTLPSAAVLVGAGGCRCLCV